MTSVFDSMRADPHAPVALTPQAAGKGGPDEESTGPELSFFLSLGASLGTLTDTLAADQHRRHSMRPPSNEQLFAAGKAPSAGNLVLDLGSVPLGRVWQIRRLIVGGVDITTVAAGKAYAFAQGAPPSDLNLTNCVDAWTSLPSIPPSRYGTHQLFLLASEHLWVVVAGGSSGQQYAASARVEDWDDETFLSTYSAE